ncbi:MAG TPA: MFS transporter [Candidatus Limnocylindrales bacterium]|nr:MFS transporter [Candidatus Limnocylindrales bacterium]
MRALAAYRGLLSNRPLTKLLGGEFVSAIGDWLYIVGILVVIYRETADPALLGVFGALRTLPYVFLSIPAGVVADRFDRRQILLLTDLARGACMLGMAVLVATDGPVVAIIGLSILAACFSTFFYPAIGAYLPSLVGDERQLGPANSAWSSLDNIGFIVGPALGGLLVATGGVTFAFLINALTFVVIAVVLWTLPPSRAGAGPSGAVTPPVTATDATGSTAGPLEAASSAATGPEPSGPVDPRPTVRPLVRPLAGIGLLHFAGYAIAGGIPVLTVLLATETLRAGEAATGLLNTAIGIGGVTGAVVSGALVLRRRLAPALAMGVLAMAAGMALLGASGVVVWAMVAIALVSAGNLVLEVVTTTIFQRVTPDRIRGRGLGVLMTVSTLAEAIGSLALPTLVAAAGAWPALPILGAVMAVAGGASIVLIGGAATRPSSPFEAILARVAKLPLFTGVGSSALERALARLVETPVAAGTAVVTQGDAADRFYIIESGRFTVSQTDADPDGRRHVLRRLGPDDVFGELGLLTGAPRSATVTADTDGVVLALDRGDFLALVGRTGTLRARLLGLYDPGPSGG